MDFSDGERRVPAESIVPMINVVFLLLIFFLMTATITPPEPFEVSPPESAAETPLDPDQALFVAADGRMAWGDAEGDTAMLALIAARAATEDPTPLIIRADQAVPGAVIVRLLKDLAAAGIVESRLVAVPPG